MAKGARASVRKANNVRLKTQVFGPVENARMERLSAKLLELASQPTPKPPKEDDAMETEEGDLQDHAEDVAAEKKDAESMDVDQKSSKTGSIKNGRVQKRRHKSSRKASIVFPKYKDKHLNKTKKQKIY